jgi:glutamate N-acetyltransferase/amino-acid N-acetyltransferase
MQKKLLFQLQIHHLVKTAIAGEDPNWGRIIMAIGKAGVQFNFDKIINKIWKYNIVQNGKFNIIIMKKKL